MSTKGEGFIDAGYSSFDSSGSESDQDLDQGYSSFDRPEDNQLDEDQGYTDQGYSSFDRRGDNQLDEDQGYTDAGYFNRNSDEGYSSEPLIRDDIIDNITSIESIESGDSIVIDDITYIFNEELGSGAFGKVWSAYIEGYKFSILYPHVAIKVQNWKNSDNKMRIEQENEIINNAFREPYCQENLLCSYGYKMDNEHNLSFSVYDLIEGGNLEDLLNGKSIFRDYSNISNEDKKRFLLLIKQIVLAIIYLHEKSIFHRDIHLGNVMLSCDKTTVKLVDFGLSCKKISNNMETPIFACNKMKYDNSNISHYRFLKLKSNRMTTIDDFKRDDIRQLVLLIWAAVYGKKMYQIAEFNKRSSFGKTIKYDFPNTNFEFLNTLFESLIIPFNRIEPNINKIFNNINLELEKISRL